MTAFLINVYAAVFNTVSASMWAVNQRIWWFIADKAHEHVIQAESTVNLVPIEIAVSGSLILLASYVVAKRFAL